LLTRHAAASGTRHNAQGSVASTSLTNRKHIQTAARTVHTISALGDTIWRHQLGVLTGRDMGYASAASPAPY